MPIPAEQQWMARRAPPAGRVPDNLLITKLQRWGSLSDADIAMLARGASGRVRSCGAREDIISEGDKPSGPYLILSGWACQYKQLANGRRQILSFLVHGDLCELDLLILYEIEHSVGSITPVRIAELSREDLRPMLGHPGIAQALWREALVQSAIQREWIVNMGQRTALQRIAHLFCELFFRLNAAGMIAGNSFEFPVTQTDLADASGLSIVHINRMLRALREARLLECRGRTVTIPDIAALAKIGLFNPGYLHLDGQLDPQGGPLEADD